VIDRRTLMAGLGIGAGAVLAPPVVAGSATTQESGEWIDLWPLAAPGAPNPLPAETIVERSSDPLAPDRIMQNIAQPRMALFRAAQPNGAAVLITPGGGYRHVVIDKEGFEMAQWLAAHGVAAAVLFYRLPHQGWATGPDTPLADAQRAMRLLRFRHAVLGIDPQRISIMGFSAGGHVAATLATRFATPAYTPVDSADALPARPDAAALIYPVISMRADIAHPGSRERLLGAAFPAALELAHSPDANVPENAPSYFILHAEDDDVVPVANALGMRAALKAKGVAVETHLYERGGHGFGISRAAGKPVAAWPEVWLAWARGMGLA
jgi:acetyl esterase/lipase